MKKNVLIVGPYLPGKMFGGPVKSLLNITETLYPNYNFFILTQDRDLNSSKPYDEVNINQWNKVGKAQVYYVPKGKEITVLFNVLRNSSFDLIYLNSFFSIHSIIIQFMKLAKITRAPVLIAPRGEFSQGALNLKQTKKKIFLLFYKVLRMQTLFAYTSTSENDEKEIKRTLGCSVDVTQANNIVVPNIKSLNLKPVKSKGKLKIVTVSRISKIKNIEYSLKVLQDVDSRNPDFRSIVFDIYGPLEDIAYWEKCEKIIESIGSRVEINYKGPLDYDKVIDVLSDYHVFLFPTYGENFGHVIQEAFLSRCPVVISDQTPWRNLSEKNIGYDIPLKDFSRFTDVINMYVEMENEEYLETSTSAIDFGDYKIKNQDSIKQHELMFEKTITSI